MIQVDNMNNFIEILNDYDFDDNPKSSKKELYDKYKGLTRFINFNSNLKKNDILEIIGNLKNYKNQNRDYTEFKIGNKVIKPNDEQLKIIKSPINNHIRIVACAGSGKTTTIICRIKYLVDNFVTPEKILVLTFNVEAYLNLKRRIRDVFGFDPKIEIRTIDGYCAKLYHMYYHEINNNKIKQVSVSEYAVFVDKILKIFGHIICNNYKFLFFDEFQDINNIQFNIIRHFSNNKCNLVVIGDDNQNIYQWRGTDNQFIINFDNIFKNTLTYNLTINYRSTESIINLANESIKYNKNRIDKNMISLFKDTKKPELILYKNRREEFNDIIDKITSLKAKYNYDYSDFAILSRNNKNLKFFEEHLTKYNSDINNKNKIYFNSLINDDNDSNNKPFIEKNKLTLMTIHKSKGLEWGIVFLIGLCNDMFPSKINNNELNIEEERRLFYVAVTRAIKKLYFITHIKDLPLTKFLKEVSKLIKFTDKSNNKKINKLDKLFWETENDNIKKNYMLKDIIRSLKPEDYEYLRNNNLLPNTDILKNKIYENKLTLNEEIKKNFIENDFGIFCNRIIVRSLLQSKHDKIVDVFTDMIINSVDLNEEEFELYENYDLKKLVKRLKHKEIIMDELKKKTKDDLKLMMFEEIIDRIITGKEVIREHTYPKTFIKSLEQSYVKYINETIPNDNILRNIYYVSLCEKFNENRRRLIYRDVYEHYMSNFDSLKNRIYDYVNKYLINYDIYCNKVTRETIKIENNNININDSITIIDKSNNSIIDIKYTENNFKIEWIIALLMSYSFYIKNNIGDIVINKLQIINLLKGKTFTFIIPKEYEANKMYDYIIEIITRQIKTKDMEEGILKIENIINNDIAQEEPNLINRNIVLPFTINLHNVMFLDTETTGLNIYNDEIIQLSYFLYNKKYELVKTFDKYIIPQYNLISKDSYNVHKISSNIIKKEGYKFEDIINEFLVDLGSTKYIIGHNVQFDINMIKNNLERQGISVKNLFNDKVIICTAQLSRKFNTENKVMKLDALYKRLFYRNIMFAHNSYYDVKYCSQCYFKMENIKYSNKINNAINMLELDKEIKNHLEKKKEEYDRLNKLIF